MGEENWFYGQEANHVKRFYRQNRTARTKQDHWTDDRKNILIMKSMSMFKIWEVKRVNLYMLHLHFSREEIKILMDRSTFVVTSLLPFSKKKNYSSPRSPSHHHHHPTHACARTDCIRFWTVQKLSHLKVHWLYRLLEVVWKVWRENF